MSLDWVSQHRAQLMRSGVLRQVLRVELIEQAITEARIPLPPAEQLQPLLQHFWQQQQLPLSSDRAGWSSAISPRRIWP